MTRPDDDPIKLENAKPAHGGKQTVVTLSALPDAAERLMQLFKSAQLSHLGIIDMQVESRPSADEHKSNWTDREDQHRKKGPHDLPGPG